MTSPALNSMLPVGKECTVLPFSRTIVVMSRGSMSGDHPRPHRLEGVGVLAAQIGRIVPLPVALGEIIADGPADDAVGSLRRA